jgi:ornithine racemase
MAEIIISRSKLAHNYRFLDKLLTQNNISWGIVTKLVCGNSDYIKELIRLGATQLMDSRISNLMAIKKIDPTIQTVYIKPAPRRSIPRLVKYADISLETDLETLRLISQEASRQQKIHKIIIMIEMGDLREGVLGDNLVQFYEKVFELPNIQIIGLGTNLNCMHGVMPSHDKLIQLSLYKQIIELKFNKKLTLLSGGTSVTIPMLYKKQIPAGVNHFRIGETLFFGNNLFTGRPIKGMREDVISFQSEIIELYNKPVVPEGTLALNPSGVSYEIDPADYGRKSWRAILDIGLLDINPEYLTPEDGSIEVAGASSDMLVLDLKENPKKYKVGDYIKFRLKYMGALALFNSSYITKRLVD